MIFWEAGFDALGHRDKPEHIGCVHGFDVGVCDVSNALDSLDKPSVVHYTKIKTG